MISSELLTFGAFLGLQWTFHQLQQLHQSPLVEKIVHGHWLVWLFHPAVSHGLQDYVVHFVVYSGQIIGMH